MHYIKWNDGRTAYEVWCGPSLGPTAMTAKGYERVNELPVIPHLHASWNFIAKKNRMTVPFYMLICLTCTVCWLHVQFWTPLPVLQLPLCFWLITLCSVASDLLYCYGLMQAYRRLEMATAYPMMRSLPIIFTAIFTLLFGWGKPFSAVTMVGFLIVFLGALLMPLVSFSEFSFRKYWNLNILFIVLVALGTTGYTVFDSRAMVVVGECFPEIAKPIRALTYYSTRGIVLLIALVLWTALSAANRHAFVDLVKTRNFNPIFAGIFAGFTYVLVLLSMNYVTNVAYVQAFRQLGLPFGMFLGIVILKEKSAAPKWIGVTLILIGLAIVALL